MTSQPNRRPQRPGRRRFLALVAGVATLGLPLAWIPRSRAPKALSLKEADFYRHHDLAG